MPISPSIPCLVLTAHLLLSCGEQAPTIAVAPEVGRACFDNHISALPAIVSEAAEVKPHKRRRLRVLARERRDLLEALEWTGLILAHHW